MNDPTLHALAQDLRSLGVPDEYYSLGRARDERTCLVFSEGKWLVYYSERGQMEDLMVFDDYGDARAYLIKYLQR